MVILSNALMVMAIVCLLVSIACWYSDAKGGDLGPAFVNWSFIGVLFALISAVVRP